MALAKRAARVLYFGRFQPFHLGHLMVLKWLLNHYDEVVILVGMASESHTWRNPFTAGERLWMIREVIDEENIDPRRVMTATLPTMEVHIGHAHYVVHSVPPTTVLATANTTIARAFEEAGLPVIKPPLFKRKTYRGEYIRRLMAEGRDEWRKLVPPAVARVIDEINGVERIMYIARRD